MEKNVSLHVNSMVIGVTQQCNMSCDHCLRGCGSNTYLDVDRAIAFLSQIDYIETITFTGGEPTLATKAIKEIFEFCKKHFVNLPAFYVVTNGLIYSQELVDILTEWHILLLRQNGEIEFMGYYNHASYASAVECLDLGALSVSLDPYHDDIPIENFIRYAGLSFYRADKVNSGDHLINRGNALLNGIGSSFDRGVNELYIEEEEGYVVVDLLYLTALGNVLADCDIAYEEECYHTIAELDDVDEGSLVELLLSA